jgi:hypothetical protein
MNGATIRFAIWISSATVVQTGNYSPIQKRALIAQKIE